MPEKCILLENKPAHRDFTASNSLRDNVLKGSLLIELTECEARGTHQFYSTPLNYKKFSDHLVKLFCEPEYVRQLNDKQFNLLLAVKHPFDCYKALEILHWAEKLKVGDGVFVTISASPQPVKGIIQYIGSFRGEEGTMFGVELLEKRGEGTSNGTYRSVECFKCDHNCGVFVDMGKLSGSERKTTPLPIAEGAPLKLGDRVIFYNERDDPVKGTARWIGVNRVAMPSGATIVGIETAQKAAAIPGSLHGMCHLFMLHNSKRFKVFLPIGSVLKDDAPTANTPDHSSNPWQSRSENDDTSQPVFDSLPLVYKNHDVSQSLPPLSSSSTPVPRGVRNRPSSSPSDDYRGYGSGYKDHRYRSHSYDSIQPGPFGQQYQRTAMANYDQMENPHNLGVGSMILYGNPSRPGVIKWMGYPNGVNALFAGIEMDEPIVGSTDGMWQGVRYFDSHPGRGMFLRVANLRPAKLDKFTDQSKELSNSYETETIKQFHNDLKSLENQVKQIQVDHSNHSDQLSTFNSITDALGQSVKKLEEQQISGMQENTNRVEALERVLDEIQRNNEELRESNKQLHTNNDYLKDQLLLTQQQLSDIQKSNELLQASNEELKDQLSLTAQQVSDVQMNSELLQANLQNQLSLTQQQLLGVQSMMTCSRLWVVSHDQFTIGREIGRGAWATVHETTFRGATVAAKCLHQLITAPRTKQLFQREMEMALQCQHQNIVTFLGSTLEDPPVILMELMDTSLRNAYEQGNIKDHQVLGILCDIASALHFLHTRPDPVIHRDVSSANVLLKALYNEEWLAKLGDLGTAKIQQQAATAGPGAMAYGAPEAGDPAKHSPKMDVYSYGILILEILTATHPFQMVDALKVQVQQQFPQYHQLVTSCTNQQSSDRPTMYDVIGQLNKIKAASP